MAVPLQQIFNQCTNMKKKETKLFIAVVVLLMCCLGMNSQAVPEKKDADSLFCLGKIATVDIHIPDSTWQAIIGNPSDKTYHVCSVTINGELFDKVAIRTKGASSLDDVKTMKSDRYSFTLKLNKYKKGQKYHGMTKLLLNNNIWDATQMKDAVVYDMCRYIGLPAPLTNYARITLNGKYFGCYLLVEAVDKHFCKRNYSEEETNIYKPYHNLAYKGDDLKHYAEISNYAKVNGDETSMQRVVAALKSVEEGKGIDKHVDVESVMKYMALQTLVVNYDCMTGHNVQNYYLREADGKISLIPWDYNLAWGGYPDDEGDFGDFAGFGDFAPSNMPQWDEMPMFESSWSKEDVRKIVNFPIDTPFSCDLSKRTFFMNLLANKRYKERYYHYLKLLCDKYIKGGGFRKTVDTINKEIGTFVGTEDNAFYSNKRFHEAMQTFDTLLQKRAASILGQMKGSIPSTWDAQKADSGKLINSDDINLSDLGGLMVMEKKSSSE